MPSAQATKLVSRTSAVTHALEHVVTMQDVLLSTTMPSATVQLDTLETHSQDVLFYLKSFNHQRSSTLATQLLVVLMLSVLQERGLELADASRTTLEIPMWAADLSVSSTQSVPTTWLVFRRSVRIPALAPAVSMPLVQSGTIIPSVLATLDTLEMPPLPVP